MTKRQLSALDRRLDGFLEELLAPMGRSERRHWARVYVQGLLLDGERKSIEPIANRIKGADVQALRQFVGQSPWAVEEVQHRLACRLLRVIEGPQVWMIDETSFPKAGEHSVGVARQYCGALGKVANCQVAVSLHLSSAAMSCPVSWRLYLPREWVEDPRRKAEGKIPEQIGYRSKSALALELIDQALEWKLPRLPVVADSAYGNDFSFREALRKRGLSYAVAVEPSTKVWSEDPNAIVLTERKAIGRPRRYVPLEALPEARELKEIALALPQSAWHTLTWRTGSKGPMRSRFARVQVWAAHGWRAQKHPERVAEWLLIEWPREVETPTDYWLCSFGSEKAPSLKELVTVARARWRVEMDYRELKEELGLDHYEGRHWMGWHHHVTLVSMAYAFLRSEQARARGKKRSPSHPATDPQSPAGGPHPPQRPLPLVPQPV